jgi:hypothetical protein
VGNENGDAQAALIVVHSADVADVNFNATLSSDGTINVDGQSTPLPDEFTIFANDKDGSLQSISGDADMQRILKQGASPTKQALIQLVSENFWKSSDK